MLITPLILKLLKINAALAMSPNISLEELLGIKTIIKFILVPSGSIAFIN
jgi:hypothetical protein